MFKIENERAGDARYSDVTEANHISQFIANLTKPKEYYGTTTITRLITRSGSSAIVLIDIEGRTYWCKPYEYEVVKLALLMSKSYIQLKYVVGAVSPYGNSNKFSASGIDGYEIHLEFD